MPTMANKVINDGASTPVAHTFIPSQRKGSAGVYVEQVGLPVNWPTLTEDLKLPAGKNGTVFRYTQNISIPVTAVVDGVTVVDYVMQANVEYLLPQKSTEQNRKDLRMYTINSQANANTILMVEKLQSNI